MSIRVSRTAAGRHAALAFACVGALLGAASPALTPSTALAQRSGDGAVLTGRVLDAESGEPVPGAAVTVEGSEQRGAVSERIHRSNFDQIFEGALAHSPQVHAAGKVI